MKTKIFKLLGLVTAILFSSILFNACTKSADTATTSTGTITFWSNQAGAPINVKINGGSYTGSITSYYSSGTPDCGASGCFSRDLDLNTSYSYTATDGTHNWSGSFSLSGSCKTLKLFW